MNCERIVLVTRQTELEAQVERFQTRSQAEFYLTQTGQQFEPVAEQHERYARSLQQVRAALPADIKVQVLERRELPRYRFFEQDIVVALGPDGLVANIARYLTGQPLIAVNPDPDSIDGVLLPVQVEEFARTLRRTIAGTAAMHRVTMSEAVLADGQRLRAVNDIFVGTRTHVSARYRLEVNGQGEEQSSSGLIVSTGVGSTGWLRSVYAGAMGVAQAIDPSIRLQPPAPIPWDARHLVFNVREPWPSMHTYASLVCGRVAEGEQLCVQSRVPAGGVIFADGMESDYLVFDSGARVQIGVAADALHLVRPDH